MKKMDGLVHVQYIEVGAWEGAAAPLQTMYVESSVIVE